MNHCLHHNLLYSVGPALYSYSSTQVQLMMGEGGLGADEVMVAEKKEKKNRVVKKHKKGHLK